MAARLARLQDVFVLSGIPSYTFVKPQEYNRLLVALQAAGEEWSSRAHPASGRPRPSRKQ